MSSHSSPKVNRTTRRASLTALAVVTVATATNVVIAEAAPAATPSGRLPAQADPSCPQALPVDSLQVGQVLNGLTVDSGTTPAPFTATVIGVIDDGIAAGLDMIIAEASSEAIDEAGGIWGGMSGSPVYIETAGGPRLVGAVAYGLAGSSPIAGITPAAEMVKLLSGGGAAAAAPEVELTATLEREIVASGAATAQEAAAGLRRLPVPVALSGTNPARLRRITRVIRRTIPGVHVYPAGRASARPAALELVPGGNVAAALSFGDVTAAAVGTVTAVCDGEALLFGHPLLFNGATSLTAHQASAVFVQPDPIFGPFKVANVGGVAGTVDQDRLAGLHTEVGALPTTTRVRSTLTSAETRASRTATTHAVLPAFVPEAALGHVLSNIDRVHDRIGSGVVTLRWGASGKRSDGTTWQLRRQEKLADSFDAAFLPAFKILLDLDTLFNNPFEPITIDRVSVTGTVDPAYAEARLVRVERLGANGRWRAVDPETPLRLVAGSEVFLRGVFRPLRSTRLSRVQLSFVAPPGAGGSGTLVVSAGASFFEEEEPGGGVGSFGQLLAAVDGAPTGDTLRAELTLSPRVADRRQDHHAASPGDRADRGDRRVRVQRGDRSRRGIGGTAQVSRGRSASAASARWTVHASVPAGSTTGTATNFVAPTSMKRLTWSTRSSQPTATSDAGSASVGRRRASWAMSCSGTGPSV